MSTPLARFLLASCLVSLTFALMGYAVFSPLFDNAGEGMQWRGVILLSIVPYFAGALIYREGYWRARLTDSAPNPKKLIRVASTALKIVLAVAIVIVGIVVYESFGRDALKLCILFVLVLVWLGTVVRAWRAYQAGEH